jgi:hypothetical protein
VSALAFAVWGLLGGATLVLCLVARAPESGLARPVEMVRRLATGPVLRLALVVAVAWTGWHLFAR